MIDKVAIGKIISKLRNDKNLTQDELAEKIEISKNYLSKVERGLSRLNVEAFLKMSEVLSFTIEDFGVNIKPRYQDLKKEELLKRVLSANSNKTNAYLKALNLIDDIWQEK
ncbi:MAG: helix-turn-helix domain-containing protein [Fusobacterium sp.]|nr:helix-turn-helix domain-containing protein [Fusobacterium sp.]